MGREFIIQRYASANWPMLRGLRPFVSTGPAFKGWVVQGSLSRMGRWMIKPELLKSISVAFPVGRTHQDDRLALAELLLGDGVVHALWATNQLTCLPLEERWNVSLNEVAREVVGSFAGCISDSFDMSAELSWGLGTLPGPDVIRSNVSDDGLILEVI